MKAITTLFKHFPKTISTRYQGKANAIYNQLLQGQNYRQFGGRKLVQAHNLIRFRLGHYRLIFMIKDGTFTPVSFISRKNLASFLKRR